jgi:uncharacterized protein (TIGR02145 family)
MNPKPIILFIILLYGNYLLGQTENPDNNKKQEKGQPNNYLSSTEKTYGLESAKEMQSYALTKSTGRFEDSRDGKSYKWVQIDKQIWMAQNLAYLPVTGQPEINCEYWVYGDLKRDLTKIKNSEKYNTYGVLYNYTAAKSACPPGWRLPMDYDWLKLESFIGIEKELLLVEGPRGEVANKLKSDSLWSFSDKELNVTGFSAIPSGYYLAQKNTFIELGASATYWSLEVDKNTIWCRTLLSDKKKIDRVNSDKENGFSIRCIKK